MILPTFLDHLVFRVAEIDRTENFYNQLLGKPFASDEYLLYMVGDTRLFFTSAAHNAPSYNKENVGLNHIAMGVRTIEELEKILSKLNEASIPHSGIEVWLDGCTKYIWLDDPDGIRIEYWLRPLEQQAL